MNSLQQLKLGIDTGGTYTDALDGLPQEGLRGVILVALSTTLSTNSASWPGMQALNYPRFFPTPKISSTLGTIS